MPKPKIIYILVILILAVLLVYLGYFLGSREKEVSQSEKPEVLALQEYKAGDVGEIMAKDEETGEESPLVSSTMPPVIFSTTGTVLEIKSDRVIIRGDGTNFADRVPRTLTVIFAADTLTFNKNQTFRWTGLAGLKQFQSGERVLIEGAGNIRGKTEFNVRTINIL